MQEILCFGELLLRLSPEAGWPGHGRLSSYVGGAELNVAMALSKWQLPATLGTALPDNPVTGMLKKYLAEAGVSTSRIIDKQGRIGTYYLTPGADLKSAGVVYDRSLSSFSLLTPRDIDYDKYFQNIRHVHLTAISPAVAQTAADTCLELVRQAHQRSIRISLDLNYRSKLWQYGKSPLDVMPQIAQYAHCIMGNIWAAGQMLGVAPEAGADQTTEPATLAAYAKSSAEKLIAAYPNCEQVGYTFRFDKPGDATAIRYFGCLYQDAEIYYSPQKDYDQITDRAGSGDCFMAGLLYGSYQGLTPQQSINFATAAATGKFYEAGDHTTQSLQAVQSRLSILEASN